MEHRAGKVIGIFYKLDGKRMCAVEDVKNGTVSVYSAAMSQMLESNIEKEQTMKFHVGDKVQKITGYKFPGIIVSVFITTNKELRYVVEADDGNFAGMLHIFNASQLELRDEKVKNDPDL